MSYIVKNLIHNFGMFITPEPQKTFRKVGFANGEGYLTEQGKEVFLNWLLNSKMADDFYKEVAKPMLDAKLQEKSE